MDKPAMDKPAMDKPAMDKPARTKRRSKTHPKRRAKRHAKPRVEKTVIGWREWVALPGLGVERIKAKIDTGARTSALHAWNIRPFERQGAPWVRFEVHPVQRNNRIILSCAAPVVDRREVRSSSGHREIRYVVATALDIGGDRRDIELTLTKRDEMGFRLLLGRTALRGHHLVDPGRSYRTGK
jgi:hypothetical protein